MAVEFLPELVMLGFGNQRQRRRQNAGISRPRDFHQAAGKLGKSPLRGFRIGERFPGPGGVPEGTLLPGEDIKRNGGKGLSHHGLFSVDIGSGGRSR